MKSKAAYFIGILFLVTFAILLGLIIFVVATGELKTMMALSAVAYSLASLGFLAVVAWAYLRGQFIDFEDRKNEVFELEARK